MKKKLIIISFLMLTGFQNPVGVKNKSVDKLISLQFSHLFNGYAQSINKQNERTGGLFETPFRRIEVGSDEYLTHLIFYIHNNPIKHGFCDDFRNYPYSSFQSLLSKKDTKLDRENIMQWFGGESVFLNFHTNSGQDSKFDLLKLNKLKLNADRV